MKPAPTWVQRKACNAHQKIFYMVRAAIMKKKLLTKSDCLVAERPSSPGDKAPRRRRSYHLELDPGNPMGESRTFSPSHLGTRRNPNGHSSFSPMPPFGDFFCDPGMYIPRPR